jgi:hypothetical protein
MFLSSNFLSSLIFFVLLGGEFGGAASGSAPPQ